jgi:hypothetical protein
MKGYKSGGTAPRILNPALHTIYWSASHLERSSLRVFHRHPLSSTFLESKHYTPQFLRSSGTSVCLSVCISAAPNGRISVKFDTGNFHEICSGISNSVKIGKKISDTSDEDLSKLYILVDGDIKSPWKRSLRAKCIRLLWQPRRYVQTLREGATVTWYAVYLVQWRKIMPSSSLGVKGKFVY